MDQRELGLLRYSKALLAWSTHDWLSAMEEASNSIRLFKAIGDRKNIVHVLTLLGYIYFDQGDWSNASSQIAQAITGLREMGDTQSLVRPLLRLGEAYAKLGAQEDARSALSEGSKLAEEFNHSLAPTLRQQLNALIKVSLTAH